MRRTSLIGVALLGSAATVAAIATCSARTSWHRPPEHTARAAPAAGPTAAPRLVDDDATGTTRTYELSLDAEAEVRPAALFPGSSTDVEELSHRIGVEGRVAEIVLGTDGVRTISLIHGAGARVVSDGAEDAPAAEAVARGIVVARAPDGHVEEVRAPVGASALERGLLEHLAELWQAAPAPAADTAAWTVEEASVLGSVAADYTRDDGGAIAKRIEHVVEWSQARPGVQLEPAIAVTASVAFEDDGALRSLDAEYATTLSRPEVAEPASRTTSRVTLVLVGRGRDRDRAQVVIGAIDETFGPWRRLGDPQPASERQARMRQALGDVTLDDLLAAIAAGEPGAAAKLRLYLELHPEATAAIVAALREADPGDAATRALRDALALAGTDQAQEGLVAVTEAWRVTDPASAAAQVAYLGSLAEPTVATEEYLRSLRAADDPAVAVTAELALGGIARAVGGDDPDRAAAIVAELVDALQGASRDRLVELLTALGNTGSPEALTALEVYIVHADRLVRRQAIGAIARIPGARSDALLGRAIAGEQDEGVLGHAVSAVALRPPATPVVDAIELRVGEPHSEQLLDAMKAELARAGSAT